MRFEVLKRDAHIGYWEQRARGDDEETTRLQLESTWQELDDEFAFIAECNLGGEYMAPKKVERLQQIGGRTWMRTIDQLFQEYPGKRASVKSERHHPRCRW